MLRRPLLKWLLVTSVLISVLALLVMTFWIAIAGPTTVYRVVRYGDTDIDDFSHYPGRQLYPSDQPFRFRPDPAGLALPKNVAAELDLSGDLDTILEANDTIAFLAIQNDGLRHEAYFQGHRASDISQLFSVTKSIFATLIGMAIQDGLIKGVDQSITDFIPELADRGFGNVTIHHLLTMTSGSSYRENDNPFGDHVILNYTPHTEARILGFTMSDAPGEVFRYKSGDNALLGLALSRALAPDTITRYAQRRLWTQLGMQDSGVWTLDHAEDGLEKTWCCLAMSARDLAKIGRLYLRHGQWADEQLLTVTWVDQSTRQMQVPNALWPSDYRAAGWRGYGYAWWLASEPRQDFFALGKDGQFLYVDPTRDLIIVRLGWSSGQLRSSQWIALFQAISQTMD